MKTVPISIIAMSPIVSENDLLKFIGQVAGECYNSSMDDDKCINRALGCIKRGHHSPFEHANITLKCAVDRGVSHALVRHRHCAFQQSSTIYQKFDELTFIRTNELPQELGEHIEQVYKEKISAGVRPSEARDCLPNCLATNLIITTNMRQWQYMFRRRNGPGDSDNMHIWAALTRDWFEQDYPRVTSAFDAWYDKHPL